MSTTSACVGSIVSCLVHSIVEHSNRRNVYEIVVREESIRTRIWTMRAASIRPHLQNYNKINDVIMR